MLSIRALRPMGLVYSLKANIFFVEWYVRRAWHMGYITLYLFIFFFLGGGGRYTMAWNSYLYPHHHTHTHNLYMLGEINLRVANFIPSEANIFDYILWSDSRMDVAFGSHNIWGSTCNWVEFLTPLQIVGSMREINIGVLILLSESGCSYHEVISRMGVSFTLIRGAITSAWNLYSPYKNITLLTLLKILSRNGMVLVT